MSAQEQRYRGETMDHWLEALHGGSGRKGTMASEILESMGPAAVPGVVEILKKNRSYPNYNTRGVVEGVCEPLLPIVIRQGRLTDRQRSKQLRLALSYLELASIPVAVDLLARAENPKVKSRIIFALNLRSYASEKFVKVLIRESESNHPWVQRNVAVAFGNQGELAKSEDAVMAIQRLLTSESQTVRLSAIVSISRLKLKHPKLSKDVRAFLLEAPVAFIGSDLENLKTVVGLYPSCEPTLLKMVESRNWPKKRFALTLLGSIKGGNATRLAVLNHALSKRWNEGLYEALLALIDMGENAKGCLPNLLKLFREDARPPLEVYDILQNLRNEAAEAIPYLMKCSKKGNDMHARLSLYTLGFVGQKDSKTLDFLLSSLKSPSVPHNYGAIKGLGELGARNARVFEVFGDYLRRNRLFNNQRLAVRTLVRLKAPKAFWIKNIRISKSKDEDRRLLAYECLTQVGPAAEGFIPKLMKNFDLETSDEVRSYILIALVSLGPSRREVLTLLSKIIDSKSPAKPNLTIYTALLSLRKIKKLDRGALIPPLIKLWKGTPKLREQVVKTIGSIKDRDSLARVFLIERFKEGDDGALEALAKSQGQTIPGMLTLLFHEDDSGLKHKVVLAMKAWSNDSAGARGCLLKGLTAANWKFRVESLRSLTGAVSITDTGLGLIEARLKDDNWHVRRAAVNLLGSLRHRARSAVPNLLAMTKDESQIIRAETAMAFARILPEPSSVEEKLLPLLTDWDLRVRCAALYALGRLKSSSKKSLMAQIRALDDRSYAVVRWAQYSLSECRSAQLKLLISLLEEGFHEKQQEFRIVIRDIGSRCLPILLKRLKSEQSEVRYCATYFLTQLGSPAMAPLFQLLKDSDALARQTAAHGLVNIGEEAGPGLVHFLKKNRSVRDQTLVLSILSKLDELPQGANFLVFRALDSDHFQIRYLAIECLLGMEEIGYSVRQTLEKRTRDSHWMVRSRARDALMELKVEHELRSKRKK